MKYDIPKNWRQTCNGQDCRCGNYGDCCCNVEDDGVEVDHTTRREYELMLEVNALHAEIGRMRAGVRAQSAYCRACHAMRKVDTSGASDAAAIIDDCAEVYGC